ncbi:DUF881 domain-containing protein [Bacillus salinus]|uniref:DUF881 domain-containing protein n=1 Tax=Bacillus sp. HMF5848 TaxID=2495421 RepID=UPI00163B5159|nr:DUF881 domain-containing protein [Bacillus sp. HMF5848]
MLNRQALVFTVITIIIGFMIAVQFHTTQQPVVRETRDIYELREDLNKLMEEQRVLLQKIQNYEENIHKYETEKNRSKHTTLQDSLETVKTTAGKTKISGEGLVLTVKPLFADITSGTFIPTINPSLLHLLINELNTYGAKHISIDGQRLINTTSIRDVNGVTKIDNYPIQTLPIDIKVIAKDAENLYNRMKVSKSLDYFAIENLQLIVSTPINKLTLPAADQSIRLRFMKAIKTEKEDG